MSEQVTTNMVKGYVLLPRHVSEALIVPNYTIIQHEHGKALSASSPHKLKKVLA